MSGDKHRFVEGLPPVPASPEGPNEGLRWFLADDGTGENTLWLTRPEQPDAPLAVLRRCDIPEGARHLWPLVPAALSATDPGSTGAADL